MDIAHADVPTNLQTAENLIASAPGSDLYVLPEMFSTGYSPNPAETAESEPLKSLAWMKRTAQNTNAAIAGSVACFTDGAYRNRLIIAHPDGRVDVSDKHHLFSFGGEDKLYAHGNERVITTVGDIKILMLVCYDVRFPVWSRCVNRDYDAIMYVANWAESRIETWDVLLRARAIENQAYVIAVNRIGTEGRTPYNGHSVILDPRGRTIASCPDNQPSSATADLSLKLVNDTRDKFPLLLDADKFTIL